VVAGFIEWEVFKGPIQTRETIIDWFYEISVLLYFLSLLESKKLPLTKTSNFLGSKSYGIYLAHVPIMEVMARGIYLIAPWVLSNQLLFFILIFITGLGLPLVGMQLFSLPKLKPIYGFLFG
jgi:peptidoglycan/LPS O-acetylase OafA/YrhL